MHEDYNHFLINLKAYFEKRIKASRSNSFTIEDIKDNTLSGWRSSGLNQMIHYSKTKTNYRVGDNNSSPPTVS